MPLTCGEWGPSFDSKKWSNKLFTVNDQRDCSPEESCMFGSFLHLGQKSVPASVSVVKMWTLCPCMVQQSSRPITVLSSSALTPRTGLQVGPTPTHEPAGCTHSVGQTDAI